MGHLTQCILPLISQHLPDLEQQSSYVGSMLVDTGMCRREAKGDDKYLMPLETLLTSLRTFQTLP